MSRWRTSFYKLVPSWLSTGDGEKVLFSLGLVADAFIERTRQSLTARFPRWTDTQGVTHFGGRTALSMLGSERGIVQGRTEDTDGYTRRLREWRGPRGHLVRGNAYALLRQVWAYFGAMRADTIDANGNRFAVSSAAVESAARGVFWDWDAPAPAVPGAGVVSAPAHDGAAGSDTSNLLIAPAATASLVLHCDGTPGRLIFLNLNCGIASSGVISTMVPAGDGWTRAAQNLTPAGDGGQYVHEVWWKVVGPFESFSSVTVACTNKAASGNERFIGRAVNVPGAYTTAPIVEVQKTTADGTTGATHALAGQVVPVLGLAFIGGRVATYSAISGGWTEIDSEITAGSIGIAIDEQYITVPTTGVASGTITVSVASSLSMIVVSVVPKLTQTVYRFWLELYPTAADGMTAQPDFGTNALWGGAIGTAGYIVGVQGMTRGDVLTLQRLFAGEHPWHPAGTLPEWCIVNLDGTAQTPDGTWGKWYKTVAGVAVESRYSGWRYIALTASLKDYLGDGSLFVTNVTIVPGGAFTTASGDGNAAAWGAVALPGGSTYTGVASNATAWAVVRLPDDGDDPA
jgi:hypothetical protein